MKMLSCFVVHHTPVQLSSLVVLRLLRLVRIMRLARNDIVRDGIRGFGGIRPECVFEAVGHVLLAASMVGIHAHLSVKVET